MLKSVYWMQRPADSLTSLWNYVCIFAPFGTEVVKLAGDAVIVSLFCGLFHLKLILQFFFAHYYVALEHL